MAGVITEVCSLVDLVGKAVNLASAIRNGLYRSSQDIASFDSQVDSLRRKQAHWEALLQRYGPRAQQLVRDTLVAAVKELEREEIAVTQRNGSCVKRWWRRTLNVQNANLTVQNVFKAFEEIPKHLREFDEADQILNRATTTDVAALSFQSDKKYVPLRSTLALVQQALEDCGGPPVITLYGEPGSGKSTLAKYLALHYDEIRTQPQAKTSKSNFFSDGVFFLACGPEATSKALHIELWQNLGFRAVFNPQSQELQSIDMGSDQQSYSESMLHKQLVGRLLDSSVLIILDDVSHTKLLERLLLPGKRLKYLVTTQYRRVWEDALHIHIARPSLEECRQILVNHVVGWPAGLKELPSNLEDIADAMIWASEFNPLVLANLALTISGERATNVEEWMTTKKYLLELLDDDDKWPVAFGVTYSQTVASSMTMAVNSMAGEAKDLLFLAAICEGPSVPEIVLKVLFKGLHGSLARFQKWSNYLEDRAFIQIETHAVEWTDLRERKWSVHRLRKHFVLEKKKDEVRAMVAQLHGINQNEADIVSALYFLFAANSRIHVEAAARLGISTEKTNFNWRSVTPFVRLLYPDGDEDWKRKSHQIAKNIIVNYLFCGELDDESLSSLLNMAEVQPATCWALETIARLEHKKLLTEKHAGTLKSLLGLLDVTVHPKIQIWGIVAIGSLALENHKIIIAQPLMLDRLLGLLHGKLEIDYNVQLYAAWTLGNLASTADSKRIIKSFPGILEALVTLLSRDDCLDVQREAAYALRRLAYDQNTDPVSKHTSMIALPGLLPKLVDLLQMGVDPEVQKEVVWLLGNLASSRDDKMRIRDQPGVLDGLVGILSKETRFDTQRYQAIYALRRLTLRTGDSELLGIPCALERLLDLLADDLRPGEQQEAAHCLSFLTHPLQYGTRLASMKGLVKSFVGLLEKNVSPITQWIATGTLSNLAEADENMIIVSEPGAIHGLISLLAMHGYPHDGQRSQKEIAEQAVRCLGQLATKNYEILQIMAPFPGALQGLFNLLSSTDIRSSGMKQTAAWILNNLAETEEVKLIVETFSKAVLTALVAESPESDVRSCEESTLTLGMNSTTGEWPQLKTEDANEPSVHQITIIDQKGSAAFCQLHTYPQRVASAMKMTVSSLDTEAKNLLFLAAICDGPSVPETVIKVFFNSLYGSLTRFQIWSKYLEDNAFIQIESQLLEWSEVPRRTWSVHRLGQLFMLEKKKDEVSAMICRLHRRVHKDADIVFVLFFLFVANPWTHEDTRNWVNVAEDKGDFNRSSIKYFAWLLQPDGDEEQKCIIHDIVKKIIVGYINHGELDDCGLSTLLEMSQVQPATCWALGKMANLEQVPLLTEKHVATLKILFELLGDGVHPNIQSWGTVAIGALATKNHKIILSQQFSLEQLLGLLKGNLAIDFNVQLNAAWTVGNLAATPDSRHIIASYPGILEALMTLLHTDEYPGVQREAVYAIKRLADGEPMDQEYPFKKTRIISLPGIIEKLVCLLDMAVDPELQKEVAWLLGNFAASQEDKMMIRGHPGVLNLLVGMLGREGRFDTQRYYAIYALRKLTLTTGDSELLRIPGAIERLAALLANDLRSDEQQEAANCFSVLAFPMETRIELAAIPGVVKGLVRLLQKYVSPSTQIIAAQALADLVEVHENKWLVANEPFAIQRLVDLLSTDGDLNPVMQSEMVELAVRCLGQLVFENYDNQLTIAEFPGALQGLLEILDHPDISSNWVQQLVAWVLSNLALAEENRVLIKNFPSAIPKLTELASKSTDPDVQWYADMALQILSSSEAINTFVEGFLPNIWPANGVAELKNMIPEKRIPAPKFVLKSFSRAYKGVRRKVFKQKVYI